MKLNQFLFDDSNRTILKICSSLLMPSNSIRFLLLSIWTIDDLSLSWCLCFFSNYGSRHVNALKLFYWRTQPTWLEFVCFDLLRFCKPKTLSFWITIIDLWWKNWIDLWEKPYCRQGTIVNMICSANHTYFIIKKKEERNQIESQTECRGHRKHKYSF